MVLTLLTIMQNLKKDSQSAMEKYLTEIKNVQLRSKYTKFRLSNHKLMIEKGRYTGLKPAERLCPFCLNVTEDELHFLLDCPTYSVPRNQFMSKIARLNYSFQFYQREHKFSYLLNNFPGEASGFIYQAFDLLQLPKCLD